MFKFISPDTLIYAESLLKEFEDGGWIEFDVDGGTRLDSDNCVDRDEVVLRVMEITGTAGAEIINFYPLKAGELVVELIESFANDFKVHLMWEIGESHEYKAVRGWLLDGNYFSIGNTAFSFKDVEDKELFLNKYLDAMRIDGRDDVAVSSEDGEELLSRFFHYCRKSIVGI